MKAPTALTTWEAIRLTVLMTRGQNKRGAAGAEGQAQRGDAGHRRERLEEDAGAGHAAPGDERPPGREPAEQVAAGAAGRGRHELADDVGPGPEQDAGGQVIAQVEHAPGVDPALGDLRQGEHGQQEEQPVPAEPAQRVAGPVERRAVGVGRSERGARVGDQGPHADAECDGRNPRPDPAPGHARVDDQGGDGGARQRAGVEQGVQPDQ